MVANSSSDNDPRQVLETAIQDILSAIPREREQEIIDRRFGLNKSKETLEQTGEYLGITRERVRQLEKAILSRLRTAVAKDKLPEVNSMEKLFVQHLIDLGRVARTKDLAQHILKTSPDITDVARVAFIAELAPNLSSVAENDSYYPTIGIREYGDEKEIKKSVDQIVKLITSSKQPMTVEQMHDALNYEHPNYVRALALVSKKLAHLNDSWGLVRWPSVNPRNIRDKIYVVLQEQGTPMHFTEIAQYIKASDFKRKDVTTQAIHNELIKDKRFVLIGRGIYALDTWGFNQGTVSDIIARVLQEAGHPMHRDEIVREVLRSRQVKETTILLNLQSKPQFKRVAKATYAYVAPATISK